VYYTNYNLIYNHDIKHKLIKEYNIYGLVRDQYPKNISKNYI